MITWWRRLSVFSVAALVAACSPATLPSTPSAITTSGGGGRYNGILILRPSAGFSVTPNQTLTLSLGLRQGDQISGRFEATDSTGTLQGAVLTGDLAAGTFQATILISTRATRTGAGTVNCEGRGEVRGTLGVTVTWTTASPITYDCGLSATSDATVRAVSPIPLPSGNRANVVVTVRPSTQIRQTTACQAGVQGYAFTVEIAETAGIDVTFDSSFTVEERRSAAPPAVSQLDMPFTALAGGSRRTYDACSPTPGTYQAFFTGRDVNGNVVRTASPLVTFGDFAIVATGTLSGRVSNGLNGQAIAGARVTVGSVSATTSSSGDYTITNAPTGLQQVTTSASGFTTRTDAVSISAGSSTAFSTALVPATTSPNVVIVLTWGQQPRDLDAHLTGPNVSGGRFHLYFAARNPVAYATLDVDDQSSFGPETVTVSALSGSFVSGTYSYYINNFSGEAGWNVSQAVVTIFQRGIQMAQYSVSAAAGSTTASNWHVFNFTVTPGGQVSLTPVQQLTPSAPALLPFTWSLKK